MKIDTLAEMEAYLREIIEDMACYEPEEDYLWEEKVFEFKPFLEELAHIVHKQRIAEDDVTERTDDVRSSAQGK